MRLGAFNGSPQAGSPPYSIRCPMAGKTPLFPLNDPLGGGTDLPSQEYTRKIVFLLQETKYVIYLFTSILDVAKII